LSAESPLFFQELICHVSVDDINSFDSFGRTALSILFEKSAPNGATIEALVKAGADVNVLAEFPAIDHFRRDLTCGPTARCLSYQKFFFVSDLFCLSSSSALLGLLCLG
jgi:hypothetical protein